MRPFTLAAVLLIAAAPSAATAVSPLANVRTAVASSTRGADNIKLDASRKPAEVLRFFGLRRGMHVLDLFGANKYWAEIMAPAVGPGGHVTVWEPGQFYGDKSKAAFADFAAHQSNVSLITSPFEAPNLPANAFDFAMLNLNYHDVYWQDAELKVVRMDPRAWLKTLHAAMKPGGIVGVIDHVGAAGVDPRVSVDKYHRIDPAVIRADFRRAGFQLVGSSNILRNPADDHDVAVFDAKVRGKTDRVIYKFRKIGR